MLPAAQATAREAEQDKEIIEVCCMLFLGLLCLGLFLAVLAAMHSRTGHPYVIVCVLFRYSKDSALRCRRSPQQDLRPGSVHYFSLCRCELCAHKSTG